MIMRQSNHFLAVSRKRKYGVISLVREKKLKQNYSITSKCFILKPDVISTWETLAQRRLSNPAREARMSTETKEVHIIQHTIYYNR